MTLAQLFEQYKDAITPKEIWHVENAILVGTDNLYLRSIFNTFLLQKKDEKPKTEVNNAINIEIPSYIKALDDKGKILLKTRAYAHAQLKLANSDEKRRELAGIILEDTTPEIERLYLQINNWKQTGEVPDEIDGEHLIKKKVLEAMNKERSLSVSVTNYKKRVEASATAQNLAKLKEYEQQLLEIRKYLHG